MHRDKGAVAEWLYSEVHIILPGKVSKKLGKSSVLADKGGERCLSE